MAKSDHFLVDAVSAKRQPARSSVSYLDGFRFGFGFFIAGLLITLLLSGIAVLVVLAFHLH